MKKTLTVLSLTLALCLAMTSCENGLPDGLLKVMGGMGNNLIGVDESKVEETVEKAGVSQTKKDSEGNISFGEYSLKIVGSKMEFSVGGPTVSFDVPDGCLSGIDAFITPSESMSDIVSALESNAGSAIRDQLKAPIADKDEAAVKGTVTLLNAAFDAVNDKATDEKTQEVLDVLKDNLVEPEGGYTKADALVLQALTNLLFATATEFGDDRKDVDPSELVGKVNDPLMELKSISDNSGSNIKIDFEQLMSALQK